MSRRMCSSYAVMLHGRCHGARNTQYLPMTCSVSCFKLYNGHERSLDVTPARTSRSLYLQFQKRKCKQQQKSVFGSQSLCGGSNSGSPEREGCHPFMLHVADFLEVFLSYPTTCLSCPPFVGRISRQ